MTELIASLNVVSEPTPWTEISDPSVLAQIPLVSVHMITYNQAPYIPQAINGVLQQKTNFPFELVIGEDCSTDNTRDIVFDYQKKHPTVIRVITSDKNVGAKINEKRTREACRGKYMALCEGDDYWTDSLKLQKQVDQLEEYPELVMSAHRAYKVDVNGDIIYTFPSMQPKFLKPRDVIINLGGFIATNSIVVRKELLWNIPLWFYEFPVGDVPLINLCIQRGKIGFINDIMSAYRKGVPGSWTSRQKDNWKKQYYHIVNVNKAYGNLIRQEKKYPYLYSIKRGLLLLLIIKLLISMFIKKPILSIFTPSQKVPPSSDY